MDDQIRRRLEEISRQTSRGDYGPRAKGMAEEYKTLEGNDSETFLKAINDYFNKREHVDEKLIPLLDDLFENLLRIYIRAHKKDPEIAEYYVSSYLTNIPGTENTTLFHKSSGLVNASLAFQNVLGSTNPITLWEVAIKLSLSYNEFLDGLLGILILLIKCDLELNCSVTQLKSTYGNRVQEFNRLLEEYKLPYLSFKHFANSKLRNAIAHEKIWLDSEKAIVHYSNKDDAYTMELAEFLMLNTYATYFADIYYTTLTVIALFMTGTKEEKSKIPAKLIEMMKRAESTYQGTVLKVKLTHTKGSVRR